MCRSRVLAAVGAVSAAAVSAATLAVAPAAQARTYVGAGLVAADPPSVDTVAWPQAASLALHAAPGSSSVVSRLGRHTSFGTPTSLAVTRVTAGWAEVISSALPNGTHAYVRLAAVSLTHDPITLEVDLSRHLLRVWRMNALLRTITVATGSSVSPTPLGRFAITDKLTGLNPSAYGCCILALSGHQEQLAPGWTGGDRLAIHGGAGIGESVSNGCLHAREADLRWLLRRVPLGTQITIHP
jgi:lipoprotein-anchoring transpeptidase ErfK/SrfK